MVYILFPGSGVCGLVLFTPSNKGSYSMACCAVCCSSTVSMSGAFVCVCNEIRPLNAHLTNCNNFRRPKKLA